MTTALVTDDLIRAAQGGDSDAMWKIVDAHDGILVGIVRSVAPTASAETAEDLLQDARVALIEHIRDYDTEASGAKLSTFAYRGCRRAVAEQWIRSTAGLSVDPTAVLRVKQALHQSEGNVDEAWETLSTADRHRKMSRETFLAVVDTFAVPVSFDEPTSLTHERNSVNFYTWAEVIPDPVSDFASATDRRDLARWLLTQIKPSHAYALRAFYGIGMERIPDEELCMELGIQRRAVSTLRSRGVERARAVAAAFDVAA
ncbi:sigma-70 family RNA polymerase sigma factor [Streptomyces sp. NPDC051130]|uniref:RNA polymerase sigma factor n=1 Tax=Streptomyces sp. NPDC051130 TaxID=3157223 RepID=UPI00343B8629